MPYVIDPERCVACGSCAPLCPVEAISKKGDVYFIDPDLCVECGTCAEQCPTQAISEQK